jgi:ACS family hexuronate transporter-like MFS transporter
VAGLIGFGGGIGGAIFAIVAGFLLSHGFGYGTLFIVAGTFHLIGFMAILLLGGRVQPLKTPDLIEKVSH